jgi:RNA polymerase sigma-70 factor (ECF subfamily)
VELAVIDEREAIAAAAKGDGAGFGMLVERYQEVAFRTAYLIVRDAQAAEDVAQDAFIRAYRRMHTFRPGEPFRPWLLRIVTNLALNDVRSRQRRAGLAERVGALAEAPPAAPDAGIAATDESAAVLAAMDELSEEDRTVLYLRHFLELPEREIATAIGKRPGTVKSRLHRASARLRKVIETKYAWLREVDDG